MLNALKTVARQIDELIVRDSFPNLIEPRQLRASVISYPQLGGKRLRPALLHWCCGLLGGDTKQALYPAAAVEIYHNWTLVHDDIIDEDTIRRGQPTSHAALAEFAGKELKCGSTEAKKYGVDFAILTGDLQQGWATNTMLKAAENGISPELTIALTRRLQELVTRELISGEALDVEFPLRRLQDISSKELMDMLYLKTGSLLRFCAEAGAAIALNCCDFDAPKIRMIGDFAATCGIAFQLRDDWLGIFGHVDKYGKSLGSDLAAKKPTLMLLKTLELIDEREKEKLLSLMGLKSYTMDILDEAKNIIVNSGADKYIANKAAQLKEEAQSTLLNFPDNQYRAWLMELAGYLVTRNK